MLTVRTEEEKARTIEQIEEAEERMRSVTLRCECGNTAFLKARLEDQRAIDLLTAARQAMPEFYFDNDIKLGHLQGSVAGVPVPRVPGLAVSEVQAPDSDSPRKCGCKGVSEDVVSALTMLVEDLDDEAKNGTKAEGEMQLERERQVAAASYLRVELISDRAGLVLATARRSQEQASHKRPQQALDHSRVSELTAGPGWGGRPIRRGSIAPSRRGPLWLKGAGTPCRPQSSTSRDTRCARP